jgi:hypothetical protein
MDNKDVKILNAINKVSSKSFISPVKVDEVLVFDETELGIHLMLLKKSGHINIIIGDYPSSSNASKSYLESLPD